MTATDRFFSWYFEGLSGLGGWFIFLLLAAAAVIWLLYDSSSRRLPALGWRLGAILIACLLLPTVLWRFTSGDTRLSLEPFREATFYLGLLGGVIPPVVAVGYFVTFRGLVGCPQGHVYDRSLGQCPDASHYPAQAQSAAGPYASPAQPAPVSGPVPTAPPPAAKPKAHAWLVADDGRTYQLNLSLTTLGRSSQNDIALSGDSTVGREHAKIHEQNGRFRITDLGSTNGTRVNGRRVKEPLLLEPDDVIEMGDNTRLRFVTSRL
jgi:hypothetical protein